MTTEPDNFAPGEWELIWPRVRHGSRGSVVFAVLLLVAAAFLFALQWRPTGGPSVAWDDLALVTLMVVASAVTMVKGGAGPHALGSVWARAGVVRFIRPTSDIEFAREDSEVRWPVGPAVNATGALLPTVFRRADGTKRSLSVNDEGVRMLKALWNAPLVSATSSSNPLNPPA